MNVTRVTPPCDAGDKAGQDGGGSRAEGGDRRERLILMTLGAFLDPASRRDNAKSSPKSAGQRKTGKAQSVAIRKRSGHLFSVSYGDSGFLECCDQT